LTSNLNFGDERVTSLAALLKNNGNYKKLLMKKNRILETGASYLVANLNQNLLTLDLSQNMIGQLGCEGIQFFLCKPWCKLQELNLEGNKLGDQNIFVTP